MSRIVIDRNSNLDANNIYLPQTEPASDAMASFDLSAILPLSNVESIGISVDGVGYSIPFVAASLTTGILETEIAQTGAGHLNDGGEGDPFLDAAGLSVTYTEASNVFNIISAGNANNGDIAKLFIRRANLPSLSLEVNSTGGFSVAYSVTINSVLYAASTDINTGGSYPLTNTQVADIIRASVNDTTLGFTFALGTGTITSGSPVPDLFGLRNDWIAGGTAELVTIVPKAAHVILSSVATGPGMSSEIITVADQQVGSDAVMGGGFNTPVTPSLASVEASRKTFFADGKIYCYGFGGFIMIKSMPALTALQSDFFSLADNKITLGENNGYGWDVTIESISDASYIMLASFKVINNGISDGYVTGEERPFVIKIERSGSNLLFKLLTLSAIPKSAGGWGIDVDPLLATLAYVPNATYKFIMPRLLSNVAQFARLDNGVYVNQFVTIDAAPINDVLGAGGNLPVTLPHVLVNQGADAVITQLTVTSG